MFCDSLLMSLTPIQPPTSPFHYFLQRPKHHPQYLTMSTTGPVSLPRITITYCTQCRWLLRAAYFAQELLSTFGTTLGEVALRPTTGGVFTVEMQPSGAAAFMSPAPMLLWDRKAEGGFPDTKVLKQRVRDVVQPERDLGHSDVGGKAGKDAREAEREKTREGEADCGAPV